MWEDEQEKEWTIVVSKKTKKKSVAPNQPKKVHFAKKLVQDSPPVKHRPDHGRSIMVGSSALPIPSDDCSAPNSMANISVKTVFGRIQSDL